MSAHDPEVHSLLGPYLLDAVDAAERAAFESHLAVCGACRDRVAELRPAAAALADRPLAPPPELRARVLSLAAETQSVRRPARRRLGVAAAAVVMAIAGGLVMAQRDDPMTAAQVFAASDVREHDMPTKMGRVRVGMSHDLHMVAVDGTGMTDPGDGMAYQVWWSSAGRTESVGMFDERESVVVPVLKGDLWITMEPADGSAEPTSAPLLSMPAASL